MSNIGLNVDEREALAELIEHPGYKVFLTLLGACVDNIERDIVAYTITADQNSERELFIRKARAEGSRILLSAVKQRIEKQRAKA